MTTQSKPYIGITGITTTEEANDLKNSLSGLNLSASSTPRLMLGILASLKTVSGLSTPNKRYPTVADLPKITELCNIFSFTTLHYNSNVRENLADQISRLLTLVPYAQGVQLNIRTPDISEIKKINSLHPDLEIILQVNFSSLKQAFGNQSAISAVSYISNYAPYIHHALLDLSGGRGTPLDTSWALEVLDRLQDTPSARSVLPGLAGGFGPTKETEDSLNILHHSAKSLFSIDAESLVRRPTINPIPSERFQDDLDLQKSINYLTVASRILKNQHPSPKAYIVPTTHI